MTHELKKVYKGIFCCLLLSIFWITAFCDEENEIVQHQNIGNFISAFNFHQPQAKLGESCLDKNCGANLICVDGSPAVCKCCQGFKIYNNECIPSAGNYQREKLINCRNSNNNKKLWVNLSKNCLPVESEPCVKNEDCCGRLLCINRICRKPGPNSEFVTLVKICLGITVTTIIIAIFSSLIKCIMRYDSSRALQRYSQSSCFNSTLRGQTVHQGQTVTRGPDIYAVHDEKPPSYEDCIRTSGGNPYSFQPPPYVIFTSTITPATETRPIFESSNPSVVDHQNITNPLEVQRTADVVNSNAIPTERSPDTTKSSST